MIVLGESGIAGLEVVLLASRHWFQNISGGLCSL
jgi:hypothetical protein